MRCDEIWWDWMRCDGIWWDLMRFDEVWWDLMRSDEIWQDLMKSDEVWWGLMRSDELWWDLMIFDEIWWDMMEYDEILWYLVKFDKLWWALIIFDETWFRSYDIQMLVVHDGLWQRGGFREASLDPPRCSLHRAAWRRAGTDKGLKYSIRLMDFPNFRNRSPPRRNTTFRPEMLVSLRAR